MSHGTYQTPIPRNEPVREYRPGSPERATLKKRLDRMASETLEVPLVIGGKEIRTGDTAPMVMPHDHQHVLGVYHKATTDHVNQAIEAAGKARAAWADMPWEERAAIFLKAGELLASRWRDTVNAATMLNQSKTVHQAEIDAACELIDFFRFNAFYMEQLYREQPQSGPGMWNRLEHRPLDGFVFAVTPFNFTSIAGNLPSAPAMLGNTVVWKPASTSVLSNYYLMQLFREAGLPDGVINFVPGSGAQVGDPVLAHPGLAGVHFTGSTAVFQRMWKQIGAGITTYKQYPRIVGETGGKDFVVAHPSADAEIVATALLRGAYEFQGQKCSAASRAYLPRNLWPAVKECMAAGMAGMSVGDVQDFRHFMGAVIDKSSFVKLTGAIDEAKLSADAEVALGGEYDAEPGWLIRPTVIEAKRPDYRTMEEELFGPVLTVFVYDEARYEEALDLCNTTSDYALTGAVFSEDRAAIQLAHRKLRFAAGNFYVNDKPTGAVVGQQPFGGSRASGTNDKAGSLLNLLRWVSPRTIKETFDPPRDYRYPFMEAE
jgi:1-pyrroline-5-carboxylate dehydrogenase